ncbi:MAG: class C sortase [Clostridiales bacterium]|nr:class C sortase [Clostridiales bacterium]
MKKHLSTVLIVLMVLAGLGLLLYPSVSNYINSKHQARVLTDYGNIVSSMDDAGKEEMFQRAVEYNEKLYSHPELFYRPDPADNYNDILNVTGTGVMGYIDIEKIGVQLPIYHGVAKEVLQIGAGHLEGTSLPTGGINTHCVLSGHRGLPSSKLFTDLDEMEIGDRFVITVLDRQMMYEVDQIKTVLPDESDDLLIVEGKDYCTLVTCTPYGINTHRLLVRGHRVEMPEDYVAVYVPNEAIVVDPILTVAFTAVPLFILITGSYYTVTLIRKRKERK